jgi:class 3 adenylate cyclase
MVFDQDILAHVMRELSDFGWEMAYERLDGEFSKIPCAEKRAKSYLILGWAAAERSRPDEALRMFERVCEHDSQRPWASLGKAKLAIVRRDFREAEALLAVVRDNAAGNQFLEAVLQHHRGVLFLHQDVLDKVLPALKRSLELLDSDSFYRARVLDTLGSYFAARDNFSAAVDLFHASVSIKNDFGDTPGMAISYGNLGRLNLDWGRFRDATDFFRKDLALCSDLNDRVGEALMYNWLGRVELEQDHWQTAEELLLTSVRRFEAHGKSLFHDAMARKDLAHAMAMNGNTGKAEELLATAHGFFKRLGSVEGLSHVRKVQGIVAHLKGELDTARELFQFALGYYRRTKQWAHVAKTLLHIVEILRYKGEPKAVVTVAVIDAMVAAERSRRDHIVLRVETVFALVDKFEHLRYVWKRTRGRGVIELTSSLVDGRNENATVMFLDLKDSVAYGLRVDPQIVMIHFNQLAAEFTDILAKYGASISGYRGDGFMAIFRGIDDALQAVRSAMELFRKVDEFNFPRRELGQEPFQVRIGIATGEVYVGNIGTYDKMDFTAIGVTANLGARLEASAVPGIPRINSEAHRTVRDEFECVRQEVFPKGYADDPIIAWDVICRKKTNKTAT